jgi:hypothetical protein
MFKPRMIIYKREGEGDGEEQYESIVWYSMKFHITIAKPDEKRENYGQHQAKLILEAGVGIRRN